VSAPGWHVGVVGIVAARLVERFHRPALVLAEEGGVAKGSGRSVEGFHLYDALARCSAHLSRFGGHKHAAGMQLPSSGLKAFSEALEAEARTTLDPAQLCPRVRIDAYLEAVDVGPELAHELQRLAPFGAGNPEPVFMCKALQASEVRLLPDKRGLGPGHLKLRLSNDLDAIGFGLGALALTPATSFDAAFQLTIDQWKGIERVQLKLKDVLL